MIIFDRGSGDDEYTNLCLCFLLFLTSHLHLLPLLYPIIIIIIIIIVIIIITVNSLMNSLFTALLFSSHQTSVWPITRPILSLMLAMPQAFHHYHETLASTQSEENRASLDREVQTLLDSLQTSLETSHRDRFTQKLTLFRLNVRSFLNL